MPERSGAMFIDEFIPMIGYRMAFKEQFTCNLNPGRVVFGTGCLSRLAEETDRLRAQRIMVVCSPYQRALAIQVEALLGERRVTIFDGAVMHVPVEVAREACAQAQAAQADCIVAAGGGSAIGLAKAIALEGGLPIVAIPTTYAGSEMTPIYGLTEQGLKTTGRNQQVLPRTVIYDPLLTLDLPQQMTFCSGINAIAHAAEGLYAADGNPITDLMALEGIAAIGRALPGCAGEEKNSPAYLAARTNALYGAWLCGAVLGNVAMALHHKLCHTLGGTLNLPHAETHTVVLPHVLAYNQPCAESAMAGIARALRSDGDSAGQAVYDLARRLGAPLSLKQLGMKEEDVERITDLALKNEYRNPRPLERDAIRTLLQNAFEGVRPT